jgi:hypothetical protein
MVVVALKFAKNGMISKFFFVTWVNAQPQELWTE